MIIYLSVLFAIVGVLMYALCANPKLQEVGRIMFACGLFVFLLCTCNGTRLVSIVPR